MTPILRLEAWRAWSSTQTRCTGSHNDIGSTQEKEPLPPLLRRRLDSTGRATCRILLALDPQAQCPLIHASRHGNTTLTWGLLNALTDGEALSPSRFSLSVHNATLGLHSIARNNYQSLQAVGACGQEIDAIFHEAKGYLAEGNDAVIAVFSESELPEAYQSMTPHPGAACVVGMRFSSRHGQPITDTPIELAGEPTPLDVIDWLAGDGVHLDGGRRWERKSP